MSYVREIFKEVFGKAFDTSIWLHTLGMNASIYLLQELGLNFGSDGYGFSMGSCGVWCYDLSEDCHKTTPLVEVKYSPYAVDRINKLKAILSVPKEIESEYGIMSWANYLATARHFSRYVCPINVDPLEEYRARKYGSGYFDMRPMDLAFRRVKKQTWGC